MVLSFSFNINVPKPSRFHFVKFKNLSAKFAERFEFWQLNRNRQQLATEDDEGYKSQLTKI
jgi:hypothetical protein